MSPRACAIPLREGNVRRRLVTDHRSVGTFGPCLSLRYANLQQSSQELMRKWLKYERLYVPDNSDDHPLHRPIPAMSTPASFAVCFASHMVCLVLIWLIRSPSSDAISLHSTDVSQVQQHRTAPKTCTFTTINCSLSRRSLRKASVLP